MPTVPEPDIRVLVQRLDPDLPVPGYSRAGDAGIDLPARQRVVLGPGERSAVPTGVAVAIPAGFVGMVTPRSGLAARHGIGIVNSPGIVDSGYRGEILVILVNHGEAPVTLDRGERIAQLVVAPVAAATLVEVEDLPPSARGEGGFGSTGR
jgi:dUTP pyrophosphatase